MYKNKFRRGLILLLCTCLYCYLIDFTIYAKEIVLLKDIILPIKEVSEIQFNHDSTQLLLSTSDSTVMPYSIKKEACLWKNEIYKPHYNSDSRYIIGLSSMGIPRIWDASNASLLVELSIPDEGMTDAIFSPDDKYIATASKSGILYIWDTKTFQIKYTMKSQSEEIRQMIFSPDSKFLASSSDNKTLTIWNLETGQLYKKLNLPYYSKNIEFNPNGKQILALTLSGDLCIWNFLEKFDIKILQSDLSKDLTAFEISPDKTLMIVAKKGGWLEYVNYKTNQYIKKLKVGSIDVDEIFFSSDSKMIALMFKDGSVQIRNINTGKLLYNYKFCLEDKCYRKVYRFSLSSDYKYNLITYRDNNVQLWDNESGKMVLKSFRNPVSDFVDFSPDSNYLCIVKNKNIADIYNPANGQVIFEIKDRDKIITDLIFSKDSNYLLVSYEDSQTNIWNLKTGNIFKSFNISTYYQKRENDFCFPEDYSWIDISSDNKTLALRNTCNHVYLWDVPSGKLLKDIKYEIIMLPSFSRFKLSSDTKRLVFTLKEHQKNIVKEMDINSGKIINSYTEFEGNRNQVELAKYSNDGKYILVGLVNGNVNLYDASTFQQLKEFQGHNDRIFELHFSSNNKYFLSTSDDNKAILWDIITGNQIKSFEKKDDAVSKAIFSPDGEYILTTYNTGSPQLWKFSSNVFGSDKALLTDKTAEKLNIKPDYNPNTLLDSVLKDYVGENQTNKYLANQLTDPQNIDQILTKYKKKMASADYIFAKYLPIYQKKQSIMPDIEEKDIISNSRDCFSGYSTNSSTILNAQPYELYIVAPIETKFRKIEVQKTNKPTVLFIFSSDENFLDFDIKPDANLKEVIIAGNPHQLVENLLNKNIQISYLFDIEGPAFWEDTEGKPKQISTEYKSFIQNVRNATGLIETSYQASLPYSNFIVPFYSTITPEESKYNNLNQFDYRYDENCKTDNIPYSCASTLSDRRKHPNLYKLYEPFRDLNQNILNLQNNNKLAKYVPNDIFRDQNSKNPDIIRQNILYEPVYFYKAQSNCCCFSNPDSTAQTLIVGIEKSNNIFNVEDSGYILLGGEKNDLMLLDRISNSLLYPGRGNDLIKNQISNSVIYFDQFWGNDIVQGCNGREIQINSVEEGFKWKFDNSIVFGKNVYSQDMMWINNIYMDKNTGKLFKKPDYNFYSSEPTAYLEIGSLYYNLQTGDSIEFLENMIDFNFVFQEE